MTLKKHHYFNNGEKLSLIKSIKKMLEWKQLNIWNNFTIICFRATAQIDCSAKSFRAVWSKNR